MIATAAHAVVTALLLFTLPFHAVGLYSVALVVLARLAPRRNTHSDAPVPATPRLALLVVAHDEEQVIAESVKSLVALRYPAGAHAVIVVADRCTDRTAEHARAAGGRVLERRDGPGGKSAAVAFGVEALSGEGFDAMAVFDADNVADVDFLEAIALRLATAEVVQGFVDSKNPGASWVAGSSALGFWAIAEMAQAPRERLGLSTPLMGTGFVMSMELARRVLTTGGGLTDDLDLAARLAPLGVRVAYEARARTVDEKPTRLGTAVAQRHRWMQGRWAVASQHVPALVREALSGSRGRRWTLLDVAFQLLAPSLLFTAVATALLAVTAIAVDGFAGLAAPRGVLLSLAFAGVYYAVPAAGIARHRPGAAVWLCYLFQPFYLVLSLPLAVTGFVTRRDRRWVRTPKGA
ncbi:MAG TPA: glycosyltransferase family 2 protein [Polyangiaceae bacterium]|jgi:cellulose synthase/poly-beta-1,6-N-acetylglucosamine synthase-like glycosyltransferase|nr:glycosyltransferase family 2 protein [Polyangiaceae bacterium]